MQVLKEAAARWGAAPWLLVAAALLAGCGTTRHEERVARVVPGTEWRRPSEEPTKVWIADARVDGSTARFELRQSVLEREFSFETVYSESRRVKDADVGMIMMAPLFLGMNCLTVKEGCFGGSDAWRSAGQQRREGPATGRTREVTEPAKRSQGARVEITAFGAQGQTLKVDERGSHADGARLDVPLRDFALSLPARPHKLLVSARLLRHDSTPRLLQVDEPQLAAMKLARDEWLPAAERRALYTERLREHLLARRHAEAVGVFAQIEALEGPPLPDIFFLRYAQSLAAAGQAARAREYAQRYLQKAGADAPYAADARALAR